MSGDANWREMARSFLEEKSRADKGGEAREAMEFGDYLLEEEIARGGMGIVFRAWQISLGRAVAVKVMREGAFADGRDVERFRQEAVAAAALRHPGIVPVFESGQHDGRVFYAMEWIAGPNLAEVTREHPASPRQAAEWVRAVAEAIQHAHGQGVVHRDLKPANVLLDGDGRPRVTDFGMARRADTASGLTLTGQMLGTPGYMAPEAASGASQMSGEAADIYGLGALLFHLLTGRAPFIGESHTAILRQLAEAELVSPRLLNPAVPRNLETVCRKALAREPARRYATAAAMAADLARFLEGRPVLARPVSPWEKAWSWARRHPALAASLSAIVVLLIGVAVLSTLSSQRLEKARRRAETGERNARQNLYAADLRVAGELWRDGSLLAVQRLLEAHRPAPGEADLRGFEWFYLQGQLSGEQERVIPLPFPPGDAGFSSDGRFVCLTHWPDLELLETATGKSLAAWKLPPPRVNGPCLLMDGVPGGKLIAATHMGTVVVDPASGRVDAVDGAACTSASLSPDGLRLAIVPFREGGNFSVEIWDVATRQRASIVESLRAVAVAWDGDGLLGVLADGTVVRWEKGAITSTVKLDGVANVIGMRCSFSTDREFVLIGAQSPVETMAVFRTRTGERVGVLDECTPFGHHAAFSSDGKWVAAAGAAQGVMLWQVEGWKRQPMRRGHTGGIPHVGFDATNTHAISAGMDRTLRWWDLRTESGQMLVPNDLSSGAQYRPFFADGGRFAALCESSGQRRGRLWDREKKLLVGEADELPLAASLDGKQIVAFTKNSEWRVREIATGRLVHSFTLPPSAGHWNPRVSPDGRWIIQPDGGRGATIFSTASGQALRHLPLCEEAMFSPDSRRLALVANLVEIAEVESGAAIQTDVPCLDVLAWSPDGAMLAARWENSVILLDARTGQRLGELSGHRSYLGAILFLPDGRTLISSGEDKALRFWNLATLREVLVLPTPEGTIHCLAASPDGRALLLCSAAGHRFLEIPAVR